MSRKRKRSGRTARLKAHAVGLVAVAAVCPHDTQYRKPRVERGDQRSGQMRRAEAAPAVPVRLTETAQRLYQHPASRKGTAGMMIAGS
jgi:hypothetical protein